MSPNIDIFISYARENREDMRRLATFLKSHDYIVATDEEIERNAYFPEVIEQMIRGARATLVLWTETSAQSQWVRKEASYAHKLTTQEKSANVLIQILLENTLLPLGFDDDNCVDLTQTGMDSAGLEKLLKAIRNDIGQPESRDAEKLSSGVSAEYNLFVMAEQLGTIEGFKGYLSKYPDGIFAGTAQAHIKTLNRRFGRVMRKVANVGALGVIVAAMAALPSFVDLYRNDGASDARLARMQEELAASKDALLISQSEYGDARRELDQLKMQMQNADAAITSAEAARNTAAQELQKVQLEHANLSQKLDQQIQESSASTAELENTRQSLSETLAREKRLQSELNALNDELDKKQSAWVTATNDALDMSQKVDLLSGEIDQLNQEKKELEDSNRQLAAANFNTEGNDSDETKLYKTALSRLHFYYPALPQVEENITNGAVVLAGTGGIEGAYETNTECGNDPRISASYAAISELLGWRAFVITGFTPSAQPIKKNDTGLFLEGIENNASLGVLLYSMGSERQYSVFDLTWNALSSRQKTRFHLHFAIMKEAKRQADVIIARNDFAAMSEIALLRSLPGEKRSGDRFGYCAQAANYEIDVTYFGDQRLGGGVVEDVAEYPIAFWIRRYMDGTYEDAAEILAYADGKFATHCAGITCPEPAPFVKTR